MAVLSAANFDALAENLVTATVEGGSDFPTDSLKLNFTQQQLEPSQVVDIGISQESSGISVILLFARTFLLYYIIGYSTSQGLSLDLSWASLPVIDGDSMVIDDCFL